MKAAILIVGDDAALLETRADLLKTWQVSITPSRDAVEEIRSKVYDLMIFCQTVPDEITRTLIHQAREMNPTVKTLAIHVTGQERDLDAELYEIQLQDPGRLLSAVALLLQTSNLPSADEELIEKT
jgi:CheY-like chemotaxis protein